MLRPKRSRNGQDKQPMKGSNSNYGMWTEKGGMDIEHILR